MDRALWESKGISMSFKVNFRKLSLVAALVLVSCQKPAPKEITLSPKAQQSLDEIATSHPELVASTRRMFEECSIAGTSPQKYDLACVLEKSNARNKEVRKQRSN